MSPNREASTRNWVAQRFFRPFADGYGYQWWLDRAGNYTALRTNGQYIAVAPAQNLVFVATGKSRGLAQFTPAELFYDYVLPAIEADGPLPPDTDASTALAAYADPPIRTHQATAVPDLPATALAISGSTYAMEDNPFKTDNFRFVFDPEKAYAELSYTARESWQVDFKIGLDGVPLSTETDDRVFVATGRWTSPDTFTVDVEIVGYSSFDRWEFRFEDRWLQLTEFGVAGDHTYRGTAE
jgi:hypothetical protein